MTVRIKYIILYLLILGDCMEVILANVRGKPVKLSIDEGVVSIGGVPQPIKNITNEDLQKFQKNLDSLPPTDDPEAAEALQNSLRAAFLSTLLGKAVGDECINLLTELLDNVHYDVLKYLGEVEE